MNQDLGGYTRFEILLEARFGWWPEANNLEFIQFLWDPATHQLFTCEEWFEIAHHAEDYEQAALILKVIDAHNPSLLSIIRCINNQDYQDDVQWWLWSHFQRLLRGANFIETCAAYDTLQINMVDVRRTILAQLLILAKTPKHHRCVERRLLEFIRTIAMPALNYAGMTRLNWLE